MYHPSVTTVTGRGKSPLLYRFVILESIYLLILLVSTMKMFSWFFFRLPLFNIYASGNDSSLYHRYATGALDLTFTPNIWPVILRGLHDLGLYDRAVTSFVLMVIAVVLIPYFCTRIVQNEVPGFASKRLHKLMLVVALYAVLYPSMLFFGLDIYRDTLMTFSMILSVYFAQKIVRGGGVLRFLYIFPFLATALFAGGLRGYLGFALIFALLMYYIMRVVRLPILVWGLLFLALLGVAYQMNIVESLILYRGIQGFETGSTSLGIGFVDVSLPRFYFLFFLSAFYQVFGFYIANPAFLLFFLMETLPLLLCLYFLYKNGMSGSNTAYFILIFCVIYTTIWLIGNDNMGTALRLRIPSYLGLMLIYACSEARRFTMSAKTRGAS